MKAYYRLVKPGIVYGNALVALAAFLFAAHAQVDFRLLAATLIGLSLAIAGACVANNIIDRDIDARMERTKDRAIPTGRIGLVRASVFGSMLALLGFAILLLFANPYVVAATAFGVVVYVCIYTPLKRRTLHSTIVGALAGAVPPVVGYVAVVPRFDSTALCLFLVLVAWQMTHFFAIAIFRLEDYRAAGLPVMPVAIGIRPTKAAMLCYALVFAFALYALSITHIVGDAFRWIMGTLSIAWVALSFSGFYATDDARWARLMFFYSILVLLAFCATLATASGGA